VVGEWGIGVVEFWSDGEAAGGDAIEDEDLAVGDEDEEDWEDDCMA